MDAKHLTWVEISRSALVANAHLFKKLVGRALVLPVIKSNAYGHGTAAVISVLNSKPGVAGFAVASLDEALAISRIAKKPVYVLSVWQKNEKLIRRAISASISLPVYTLAQARFLDRVGKKVRRKCHVQIKIDVGTMRLGFRYDDFAVIMRAFSFRHLEYGGIFSHFADSENRDEAFTQEQEQRFSALITRLAAHGIRVPLYHIACSASTLRDGLYRHSGARIGISLFGLWPSVDIRELVGRSSALQPVLTWKTRVIQVKHLKKGEAVGYGLSFRAHADTRIAVLPVGYWDGYDRRFSNQADVLIGDARCLVRGRVCMNLTMVELPASLVAQEGSEAVLLGAQGRERVTAEELARIAATINYEIVTRINPLLPRIVVP